jgi:uncharacterized protein YecT (DUF1311 family)
MNECVSGEVQELRVQLTSTLAVAQRIFGKKLVQIAQRQWKRYVTAECTMEASPNRGGSIYPFIYGTCVRNLTVMRIKEIRDASASQPQLLVDVMTIITAG